MKRSRRFHFRLIYVVLAPLVLSLISPPQLEAATAKRKRQLALRAHKQTIRSRPTRATVKRARISTSAPDRPPGPCTPPPERSGYIPIGNARQLFAIERNMSANFFLCNDIDLISDTSWHPLRGPIVQPVIGFGTGSTFTGHFEGNNKRIVGVSRPLFNQVGRGGRLSSLELLWPGLNGPNESTSLPYGALAARNTGTLDRIVIRGPGRVHHGNTCAGGVVGVNSGTLRNILVDRITVESNLAGGIAGCVYSDGSGADGRAIIEGARFKGQVGVRTFSPGGQGGGIAGRVETTEPIEGITQRLARFVDVSVDASMTSPADRHSTFGGAVANTNGIDLDRTRVNATLVGEKLGGIVGNITGSLFYSSHIRRSSFSGTLALRPTTGDIFLLAGGVLASCTDGYCNLEDNSVDALVETSGRTFVNCGAVIGMLDGEARATITRHFAAVSQSPDSRCHVSGDIYVGLLNDNRVDLINTASFYDSDVLNFFGHLGGIGGVPTREARRLATFLGEQWSISLTTDPRLTTWKLAPGEVEYPRPMQ